MFVKALKNAAGKFQFKAEDVFEMDSSDAEELFADGAIVECDEDGNEIGDDAVDQKPNKKKVNPKKQSPQQGDDNSNDKE